MSLIGIKARKAFSKKINTKKKIRFLKINRANISQPLEFLMLLINLDSKV